MSPLQDLLTLRNQNIELYDPSMPFPRLPVNLDKLSLTPKTDFLIRLETPYKKKCIQNLIQPLSVCTHLYDTNAELLVKTMNDDASPRFIERIGHPRTDILEKTDRISHKVCETHQSQSLSCHFLSVMVHDTLLQFRHRLSQILEDKSI